MTDEPINIRFTAEAIDHAEKMVAAEPAFRGKPLRVYIEGKGCDGFYYGVAFDEKLGDDWCRREGALEIVVDRPALQFINGVTIDWVDDERGCGFLVENPRERHFRGKFYKRKDWQNILTSKKPG